MREAAGDTQAMPAQSLGELGLLGTWELRRIMHDRRQAMFGHVQGALDVVPDGDGAEWTESGTLTWGALTVPVTRRLLVRQLGGQWWLTFSDGRQFHPWQPDSPVLHPCSPDEYRGLVRIRTHGDHATMRILWDVSGPAKDQRILTALHQHRSRP